MPASQCLPPAPLPLSQRVKSVGACLELLSVHGSLQPSRVLKSEAGNATAFASLSRCLSIKGARTGCECERWRLRQTLVLLSSRPTQKPLSICPRAKLKVGREAAGKGISTQ